MLNKTDKIRFQTCGHYSDITKREKVTVGYTKERQQCAHAYAEKMCLCLRQRHLTLRKSMRVECGFLPACVSISKGNKDTLTSF